MHLHTDRKRWGKDEMFMTPHTHIPVMWCLSKLNAVYIPVERQRQRESVAWNILIYQAKTTSLHILYFFCFFRWGCATSCKDQTKCFFPFRRFSNYPIFSLSWKYPDWPFSPILIPLLFSTSSLLMILYHQISFMITWIGYDLTPSFGSFCSFFRFYGFNDFSSPISEDFLNPSGTWSFMSMKNSKWKKWSLPISVHFIWQSFIAS